MVVVSFRMDGTPKGKVRPRTRIITPAFGEPYASIYTDAATRAYEASIGDLAKRRMGNWPPLEGALAVTLRFRLPLPVSMSKRQRAAILAGEQDYLGPSDVDNYAKAALDGMNKIVFNDDKQVRRLYVVKDPAEQGGLDVRVEALRKQPWEE